ncbi:MAG: hypothetical protein HYT78_03915 [Deltaproteobacteria bacterium]|nr:hypothetical protein [Deltaproteobacteria bacterium]
MFYRYRYENEIYPTQSRVPLHVRMKLDLTGLKISLKTWLGFSLEERWALCHLPVDSEEEKQTFISYLDFLCRRYFSTAVTSVPAITDPPWEQLGEIPDSVLAKSRETAQALRPDEWHALNSCQRYALYKLSISKNEPEQFFAVLSEFREAGSSKT